MNIICPILALAVSLASLPGEYLEVSPDSLGVTPDDYIGVKIKLKCRFLKLDSTWIGDPEVYRSAADYVGFSVQAGDRVLAQLFAPVALKPELDRFDKGDRLIVYGQVFSSRYNFPWIDVSRVSEGWVVGEEAAEVSDERRELARDYEDFLRNRQGLLKELDVETARRLYYRQEALIWLLLEKGVFSREEFDAAVARQGAAPSPVPPWQHYLEGVPAED
ncbi:MAG TPA: hypothetical protein PLI51_09020 [bacterium]|nr:hypothetical protein [bacterium]HPQ66854.1 hypothetical protein [bacterium]